MTFYQIDPAQDPRWAELLERHSSASVFHTAGWLKALRDTYGYEPVAFTTSSPAAELNNALVFCAVKSWITGRRLVSLPFSDHCEPLCDSAEDLEILIRHVQTIMGDRKWKYLELRPINGNFCHSVQGIGLQPSAAYFLHLLDLHPDLDRLFRTLDKDSVQRRIHRARRAGLVERRGRSDDLLDDFYGLFVITRGRQHLPPTPYAWFRNLIRCLGEALEIRVAYEDAVPVAAILTLRFKDVVYYKYGCSDAGYNRLGATPWLLWNAIAAARSRGAVKFDMGRTHGADTGLLAFKNHWVPHPERMVYWTFPHTSPFTSSSGPELKLSKLIFSYLPNRLLTVTGKLIYRHIG
jgi:Acetyltransferase (GNAT) domain